MHGTEIVTGHREPVNSDKIADGIKAGSRIIGNAGALIQSGGQAVESAKNLYDSYVKDGEVISWKNTTDLITLGLSVAGMGMAGKSLAKDGKALKAVSQGNVNVKPAAVSNSTAASDSVVSKTGPFKMNLQMFAKSGNGTTLVTHRGTNEHIEKVLQQGYIQAYGPRTPIDAFIDHKNPAVWVSEGRPTWFNRIFSGMVGKRGEASITFEVPSELIKKPSGIKKIFGKVQRVIEQDVEIPDNVIVRKVGK